MTDEQKATIDAQMKRAYYTGAAIVAAAAGVPADQMQTKIASLAETGYTRASAVTRARASHMDALKGVRDKLRAAATASA